MATSTNATQLIALDALVIDTETTGLDPTKARLIEIAAVPVSGIALVEEGIRHQRVRPDSPIPPASTAIHGIDDSMVRDAPAFPEAWPTLLPLFANRVVIGHSIGYDLAVLRAECARARVVWNAPRTLDTRLLAQAVRPDLAGHSLDQLAAWLGVTVENRHTALGDARVTAQVYFALLPLLRQRGVRTLAEAEQACRTLTATLDGEHQAGWVSSVAEPAQGERPPPMRLDTQPFRHCVSELMSAAQTTTPETTIAEAIADMESRRISSLFVIAKDAPPRSQTSGIITERDVLRAIARHGAGALAMPVKTLAASPVLSVPADAYVYRAIGRMRRLKVRHLGVTDDEGNLIGAVSARDLLRQRAEEAIWLGEEIDEAANASQLARGWEKLPLIAEALLAEGVSGREIAAVVSRELCALTARAAGLAEARMRAEGHGGPPCSYAFAVLGSAGRGESLMALDQDNALVFADGAPDGPEDKWFARFAGYAADLLNEVGVPYCKGGVMAKSPAWRGSMITWRDRIGDWIRRSRPEDLLSVDIFFDLRGVAGDTGLANDLRREAFQVAAGETAFAKLLAEAAGTTQPGLGFFGRIRTEQGRIDLKRAGLFGIVTAARVLAISHNITERSTPARLAAIKALGIGAASDLDALDDAHATFLDLILNQQIEDMAQGTPPGNSVVVRKLSGRDRERLKTALEAVRHIDDMARGLLFKR